MQIEKRTLQILQFILPIFLGAIIYICFRNQAIILFQWFELVGLGEPILNIREWTVPLKIYMPDWVIYSLPDGLWVYSWTAYMYLVWDSKYSFQGVFWKCSGLLAGVGIEVFQFFKYFPGTFDIYDVILSFVCFVTVTLFLSERLGDLPITFPNNQNFIT